MRRIYSQAFQHANLCSLFFMEVAFLDQGSPNNYMLYSGWNCTSHKFSIALLYPTATFLILGPDYSPITS